MISILKVKFGLSRNSKNQPRNQHIKKDFKVKRSELLKMKSSYDNVIEKYEGLIKRHQESTMESRLSGETTMIPPSRKNKYVSMIITDLQKRLKLANEKGNLELVVYLQSQLYRKNKEKLRYLKQLKLYSLQRQLNQD